MGLQRGLSAAGVQAERQTVRSYTRDDRAATPQLGKSAARSATPRSAAVNAAGARTLRPVDGPDEVHKILIARDVLERCHAGEGWDFGN